MFKSVGEPACAKPLSGRKTPVPEATPGVFAYCGKEPGCDVRGSKAAALFQAAVSCEYCHKERPAFPERLERLIGEEDVF